MAAKSYNGRKRFFLPGPKVGLKVGLEEEKMGYLLLCLWMAVEASPLGVLIGAPAGVIIGAFLANHFLGHILVTPWLVLAVLVAACAGGYVFGLGGGFIVGWTQNIISRF